MGVNYRISFPFKLKGWDLNPSGTGEGTKSLLQPPPFMPLVQRETRTFFNHHNYHFLSLRRTRDMSLVCGGGSETCLVLGCTPPPLHL